MAFWHKLHKVAELSDFDPSDFVAWAIKNRERYGIVIENDKPLVNNWWLDEIVVNYRNWKRVQESKNGTKSQKTQ